MSRLPEDPGYWERLTTRIVTSAGSQLAAYRSVRNRQWQGLARFAIPLTIGAATTLIIASLWRPHALRNARQSALPATVYGFTLTDPLAAQFITAAAPPTMATLLATLTLERTP